MKHLWTYNTYNKEVLSKQQDINLMLCDTYLSPNSLEFWKGGTQKINNNNWLNPMLHIYLDQLLELFDRHLCDVTYICYWIKWLTFELLSNVFSLSKIIVKRLAELR